MHKLHLEYSQDPSPTLLLSAKPLLSALLRGILPLLNFFCATPLPIYTVFTRGLNKCEMTFITHIILQAKLILSIGKFHQD